ncbi:MAG TPA: phosphoribosylformylglycinamidine synthase subunit PurS [Abditibacteriaceae bacterium]|jgi:phosphoribosylformylglycinamidine synthase|nr:phosphoribosylformylglycinamidine synthase subunit PurS [Abditibacteriaceae bacterium]
MSTAQIHITLKPALLDTQGATVLKALHQLGHTQVNNVRIGKLIEVQLDDLATPTQQQAQLETMCRQLLANSVIEDFSIVFNDGTTGGMAPGAQSSTRTVASNVETRTTVVPVTVAPSATMAPASNVTETSLTASPTNPVVNVVPVVTTQATPTAMPVVNEAPPGSEPTAIGDPFAVSYTSYDAMTADEKLDLQGRAWNLHGASILRELDARRAAWLVQAGNRVLDSGVSLDTFPTDAQLSSLGTQLDLVPFVFTRPPQ